MVVNVIQAKYKRAARLQHARAEKRSAGFESLRMQDVRLCRVCYFGSLKGVSKSVQVLYSGIEAVLVLLSIILN